MIRYLLFSCCLFVALASPLTRLENSAGKHSSLGKKEESRFRSEPNLIEVAERLGATSLIEYAARTNLTTALKGPGPYTLFAPTNEAFERLPPELSENMTNLHYVLLYHAIGRDIYASQITNDMIVQSVLPDNDIRFNVYTRGERNIITAEGSSIIIPDRNASNGVVHLINRVMYPPLGSIMDFLQSPYGKNFSTLLTAIQAADLEGTLSGKGPFTLFTPGNWAFDEIPKDVLDRLLKNKTALVKVLNFHVVPTTLWSHGISNEEKVKTAEGETLVFHVQEQPGRTPHIEIDYGKPKPAHVVYPDLAAKNGVMHLIDTVLFPPDLEF